MKTIAQIEDEVCANPQTKDWRSPPFTIRSSEAKGKQVYGVAFRVTSSDGYELIEDVTGLTPAQLDARKRTILAAVKAKIDEIVCVLGGNRTPP
jgi:hypothetical protein